MIFPDHQPRTGPPFLPPPIRRTGLRCLRFTCPGPHPLHNAPPRHRTHPAIAWGKRAALWPKPASAANRTVAACASGVATAQGAGSCFPQLELFANVNLALLRKDLFYRLRLNCQVKCQERRMGGLCGAGTGRSPVPAPHNPPILLCLLVPGRRSRALPPSRGGPASNRYVPGPTKRIQSQQETVSASSVSEFSIARISFMDAGAGLSQGTRRWGKRGVLWGPWPGCARPRPPQDAFSSLLSRSQRADEHLYLTRGQESNPYASLQEWPIY